MRKLDRGRDFKYGMGCKGIAGVEGLFRGIEKGKVIDVFRVWRQKGFLIGGRVSDTNIPYSEGCSCMS